MTPDRAQRLMNQLRADLTRADWPDAQLPDRVLIHVIQHIGLETSDIAYTALLQYPRPMWLAEIAGSYPYSLDAELLDVRDIANPGW